MPFTSNSVATPYITGAEFLARNDINRVAMLAADDQTIPTLSQLNDATTPYGQNLLAALMGASGEIESSLFVSDRYRGVDLNNLTGVSLSFLKDIVAALAMERLQRRRGVSNIGKNDQERYEKAHTNLTDLETGRMILSFQEVETAGLPTDATLNAAQVSDRDLLSRQMSRFFGQRYNQRRSG
jgi:hypothetical protein